MASAEAKIKVTTEDKTKKGIASAQTGVSKLTQAVKSYGVQMAAVFLAARKVYKIAKDLTAAFMKQEEAVAALDSALRSTGIYTHDVSGEMQELAKQLQATTKYGDEATLAAMGLLQSLAGLSSEGLQDLTPLLLDFATGMRIDLNTAASLVGKTLGSTTNALSRYGIVIDMTGTKAEKLAELQEQINSKFNKMASIMGGTFAGKVTRLNNLFGDMKETMGGLLAEAVEPLIDSLIKFASLGTGLEKIVRIIRGIAAWTVTWVGFWLNVYGAVIKSVVALVDTFKNLGKVIGIVFNPKKWGKGEMKAALDDIKTTVADTAINIGETWEKWVIKVQTSWAKALADDVMPVIQTFEDETAGMVGVMEEVVITTEKAIEVNQEWADTIVYSGEILASYISGLESMWAWEKGVTEATDEGTESIMTYSEHIGLLSEQIYDVVGATKKLREEQEKVNEVIKEQVDKYFPSWAQAWDDLGNSTISAAEAMGMALKNMIADYLMGLSKQAFAEALLMLAKLRPGRAAMFFTASAMAAAASGFIRSFAEGGEFITQGPQMIMVGDNPGGRERVRVEPESSSGASPISEGQVIAGDVYFDGDKVGKWMTRASRSKQFLTYKGAIVNV